MQAAHLMHLANYNVWANAQFEEYFYPLSPDILSRELPGSFPSLAKTFIHIWDAQDIWLRRLKGERTSGFQSTYNPPAISAIWPGISSTSEQLVTYVEASLSDPDEIMHYHTVAGKAQSSRRSDVLTHVFFHSMYHRGQCVTMARTLELEGVPSTDFIRYTWTKPWI